MDTWICEVKIAYERGGITNSEAKVEELMDNRARWWDVSKVRSLLPPPIAAEVFKMVISFGEHEATHIWALEKDGKFIVKSAYCLFRDMSKAGVEGINSKGSRQKRIWKEIWEMQIPNKVKVFA